MDSVRGALVIACGALAREIAALRRVNGWTDLDVCYLPPQLHNRPERIAHEVQLQIRDSMRRFARKGSSASRGHTAMNFSPRLRCLRRSPMPNPVPFI